jgi:hypothetical protein
MIWATEAKISKFLSGKLLGIERGQGVKIGGTGRVGLGVGDCSLALIQLLSGADTKAAGGFWTLRLRFCALGRKMRYADIL